MRRVAPLLLLLLAPGAALGAITVFHSPGDNGLMPGLVAKIPIGGSGDVELWFDTSGGETVLGWDLSIATSGGVTVTSFDAEAGVVHSATPALVRANGGESLAGETEPVKIGTLSLSAPSGGSLAVSGSFVDGALAAVLLQTTVVASATSATLCGDANGDGTVSALDIPAIASELGGGAPAGTCDADGDGTCTAADASRVQLHLQSLTALLCS